MGSTSNRAFSSFPRSTPSLSSVRLEAAGLRLLTGGGPHLFSVGLRVLPTAGNRRIVYMDSTLRAAAEYILGLGCMYGLFAASEDVVRCRCRFDAYILLPIIIATYYYVKFFELNSLYIKIPKLGVQSMTS